MKKVRRNNNLKNNKLNFIFISVICLILGILSFQCFVLYKAKIENNRLLDLKKKYKSLCSEVDTYNMLKSQYEIILNESTNLRENKEVLEEKLDNLNKEIKELESKITNINNKIKNFS